MNKYRARKVKVDGETFDSVKEYSRWCDLKLLERVGEITELRRQVKFVLIPTQREDGKVIEREASYIADFVYRKNGKLIVEDVKGFKTPEYILKRKLMLFRFGYKIKET